MLESRMLKRETVTAVRRLLLFGLGLVAGSYLIPLPASGDENLKQKIERFAPIEFAGPLRHIVRRYDALR
ncbi:MAG: hypothetical protein ACE15E_22465 [Acidobacteriota bacterium]